MNALTIAGAGPAGASAAIEARSLGLDVRLFDPSAFPRHRVCGEFLSGEIEPILTHLGLWDPFLECNPHRYRRFTLHFPRTVKRGVLPGPAFGLSRYRFDRLLLEGAISLGATHVRARAETHARPLVLAHGRKTQLPQGDRLFGFKSHFIGPRTDSIDLFFFPRAYVGVNCVEDGLTNVCGVAPEDLLGANGFRPDDLLAAFPPLRDRTRPLNPASGWMFTGPLAFQNLFDSPVGDSLIYPAGDALSFVDPFTGSGLVSALFSGIAAAQAVSQQRFADSHITRCRRALAPALRFATLFRTVLDRSWVDWAVRCVPGQWLFRATRPETKNR